MINPQALTQTQIQATVAAQAQATAQAQIAAHQADLRAAHAYYSAKMPQHKGTMSSRSLATVQAHIEQRPKNVLGYHPQKFV